MVESKLPNTNKFNYQFTHDIFNSTPALVAYLDNDFNFLLVNKAYANTDFERSKGKTDYYIGQNHFILYPNEENEKIFRQVIKTQKSVTVYDKLFEYQDGRKQYFDWYLIPLAKPVPGLILTIFETSDRTLAQLGVKNLAYKLDQIITYSNEAICVIEKSGQIIFANSNLSSLLGFNKEYEVINKNLLNFIPREQKTNILTKFENNLSTDFKKVEVELLSINGTKLTTLLSIIEYNVSETNESDKTFLCLFLDITQRKMQEIELLNQRNELYLYSSFIAHDLRNNLNKINQYYFLMKKNLEETYPDFNGQYSLDKINEQIFLLDNLIQRTLELAETGNIIKSFEHINLKNVIDDVLDSLVYSKSNIEFDLPSKYPSVRGEKVKLYQLFLNLFTNALKHSNPTKVFFSYKFDINFNDKEKCIIKLKYDGVPFPKEIIKNINDKEIIKGLGVQIINSIIDAHHWNWEISVEEEDHTIYNIVQIFLPKCDLLVS